MERFALLLNGTDDISEIRVDGSPMSPFTHDALGGTPTILGSWDEVVLLGLSDENARGEEVDSALLRPDRREPGVLRGPLLLVRVDGEDVLDFRLVDHAEWLSR